jgi:5-methylcytosine-specific restriction endonuclease McrA
MDTIKHNPKKRKTTLTICVNCGEAFTARNNRAKYCNRQCQYQHHKKTGVIKTYSYLCAWCWQPFESQNNDVKFCSRTCVGAHQRQEAIDNNYFNIPRHIFPDKEARRHYIRRKRLRENWVEYVDIEKLIERDKAICQLCFKLVPADVDYNHPLAATIDHIIPVSKGGEHSYANCQLAHRKCNTHKNARTEVNSNGEAKQKCEGSTSEVTN